MNGKTLFRFANRDDSCGLRLILMRHGTPAEEVHGRCYGRLDVGLSPDGRQEIDGKIALIQSMKPQALYTSPCKRTIESAEEIGRRLNLKPTPVPQLCEIDFGAFEGLTYQEIASRYPHEYKLWMERPTDIKFPQGESLEEMKGRAFGFLEFLSHAHRSQTVLVLSHGGVNRVLLADALRLATENLFRIDQAYAAVNVIDYYPADFALVRLMNG